MRQEVLLGAERRRRWSDDEKLGILAEVARNGWSVADVARRHDLTRQHIYQWRRELRRKPLWPRSETATSCRWRSRGRTAVPWRPAQGVPTSPSCSATADRSVVGAALATRIWRA